MKTKVDVLLGLQWGDEGKGKVVDVLTPHYDLVARFQGGPNAGHTLEFDGEKHVLRSIPSGVFQGAGKKNIIGNGVVLDPVLFSIEAEELIKAGIPLKERLLISKKAHLILPTHRLLDGAYEAAKGDAKIGTTNKGIGPTYTDKISRNGLRVGDLLHDDFRGRYDTLRNRHFSILRSLGAKDPEGDDEFEKMERTFFDAVEYVKGYEIVDGEFYVNDCLASGRKVLAEGAQGSLLDVDFGSYPFVTSSNTVSAGCCTGLGVAPRNVGKVFGIFKAYCTRVGAGPFPTELFDEDGKKMAEVGHEFGAVTGRPRRCGWLDLVALKYTTMLNGVTDLIMMKSDVLDSFDEIKVCTKYRIDGRETDRFPFEVNAAIEPIYERFRGWNEDLTKKHGEEELPKAFLDYVQFIEEFLGIPISILSIGPDRTQTIVRKGFEC